MPNPGFIDSYQSDKYKVYDPLAASDYLKPGVSRVLELAANANHRKGTMTEYLDGARAGVSPQEVNEKKTMEQVVGQEEAIAQLPEDKFNALLEELKARVGQRPEPYQEPTLRQPNVEQGIAAALGAVLNPQFAFDAASVPFQHGLMEQAQEKKRLAEQYAASIDAGKEDTETLLKLMQLQSGRDVADFKGDVQTQIADQKAKADAAEFALKNALAQQGIDLKAMGLELTKLRDDRNYELGSRRIDLQASYNDQLAKHWDRQDDARDVMDQLAKDKFSFAKTEARQDWAHKAAKLVLEARRTAAQETVAGAVASNSQVNALRGNWDAYNDALKAMGLNLNYESALGILPEWAQRAIRGKVAPPTAPGFVPVDPFAKGTASGNVVPIDKRGGAAALGGPGKPKPRGGSMPKPSAKPSGHPPLPPGVTVVNRG